MNACRFLFRFTGDDSEVSLDGDEANPPEFVEWKWMDIPHVLQGVRGHCHDGAGAQVLEVHALAWQMCAAY